MAACMGGALQQLFPLLYPGIMELPLLCMLMLFAADKGSWCEQQLCACDKEVAICLQRNLDTYQKRLRHYWRPHCRGKTPMC
ncbi:hypothetical protein MC885_005338 [Smutsia gigantea]|nr:hypothetical protein MC885_005338 [Smutsia gigantea]